MKFSLNKKLQPKKILADKFDWNQLSKAVVEGFGGVDNLDQFLHCATRLRIHVKDEAKVNQEALKKIALSKGLNKNGDQWQLIFGAGTVNKVYEHLNNYLSTTAQSSNFSSNKAYAKIPYWNKKLKFHSNLFLLTRRGIRGFADIFIPLIPIFIAGGLSLALESLVVSISKAMGTEQLQATLNAKQFFSIIGGAILGSLPAFIGYTAMKKFGGSPMIGLAIGLIMVAPSLINGWSSGNVLNDPAWKSIAVGSKFSNGESIKLNENTANETTLNYFWSLFPNFPAFFRFDLVGYQAQVFPTIMIVALAYWIERGLKKITPEFLAIIVIPLGTIFLSVFFGFWFIGPAGRYIGYGLALFFAKLFEYTNYTGIGFGAAIFAFSYPFLVVTGLHQGLLPIENQLLTETRTQLVNAGVSDASHGYSWITPIATVSNVSQAMVGLAIMVLLIRKKASKIQSSKALSGGISANLGITEPILFGVNLPMHWPLVIGAIASAFGGYWIGATHTVASSLGSASWLGLILQFDFTITPGFSKYLELNHIHAMLTHVAPAANMAIAMVISTVAAFGLTWVFSRFQFFRKSFNEFADMPAYQLKPMPSGFKRTIPTSWFKKNLKTFFKAK